MAGDDTASPDDTAPAPQDERSFEQALAELEDHVRRLDSGELPLEESLGLFEQGVRLVKECHELLDDAERRIVEVSKGADGVVERPFDGGARGGDEGG